VNNKANLEKLVPQGNTPLRKKIVISIDQNLPIEAPKWNPPVVIKAVTDETTGGGVDVRICHDGNDIQKPLIFHGLPLCGGRGNIWIFGGIMCLHYCVTAEGVIDYLGFAEQVSDETGIYLVTRLKSDANVP